MREAAARGERLSLANDEIAFYDVLQTNDSAVQVLGDDTLRALAPELLKTIRSNVAINWMLRENVQVNLRVLVSRILYKHSYRPDKHEKATQMVLEQTGVLSESWCWPERCETPATTRPRVIQRRYRLPSS